MASRSESFYSIRRSMTAVYVAAALFGGLVLANTASVSAHELKHKHLTIVHPWTFPTSDELPHVATVHMKIRNMGKIADRLLSAASPRAVRVELHNGSTADPRPAATLSVPAGTELRSRIMLHGIIQPFET